MVVKIVIYLKNVFKTKNTKMSAPGFQSRNMQKERAIDLTKKFNTTYIFI